MTREEICKVVKEIKEHCKNNNCKNCEAYTIHGCVFTSGSPDEWSINKKIDKAESEKALEREEGYLTDYIPTEDFNEIDDIILTLKRRQSSKELYQDR